MLAAARAAQSFVMFSLAPGQQTALTDTVWNLAGLFLGENGGFASRRRYRAVSLLHTNIAKGVKTRDLKAHCSRGARLRFSARQRERRQKTLHHLARYLHAKCYTSIILQWLRMEPRRRRPLEKSLSFTRLSSMSHGTTHTSPTASWDAISRVLTETLLKEPG